jgi:hypothetical protein
MPPRHVANRTLWSRWVSSLLRVVDKEKAHPGTEGFSGKVECTAMSGLWDQSEHWRAVWGSTRAILELPMSVLAERWLREDMAQGDRCRAAEAQSFTRHDRPRRSLLAQRMLYIR